MGVTLIWSFHNVFLMKYYTVYSDYIQCNFQLKLLQKYSFIFLKSFLDIVTFILCMWVFVCLHVYVGTMCMWYHRCQEKVMTPKELRCRWLWANMGAPGIKSGSSTRAVSALTHLFIPEIEFIKGNMVLKPCSKHGTRIPEGKQRAGAKRSLWTRMLLQFSRLMIDDKLQIFEKESRIKAQTTPKLVLSKLRKHHNNGKTLREAKEDGQDAEVKGDTG